MEIATPFNPNPFLSNPILYSRANFDGIHYINIAAKGSIGVGQQAFFPLYIKLINLFKPVFKNATFSGVLISLASFVFGTYFILKLSSLDYTPHQTKWIYLGLVLFPTSFYFTFVYTEGLFFALSVSSFYFARKKKWLMAAVLAALASYTRVTGVVLFPVLLTELFFQNKLSLSSIRKQFKNILFLCLIPGGLILYMWQLQNSYHDPLAFIHVQSSFYQGRSDSLVLFPQVVWRYLKIFATFNIHDPLIYTLILEFISSLFFLYLAWVSFIRQRPAYALFNFICFILPTFTGVFTSMPRYVLACFPSFFLIGKFLADTKPLVRYTYLGLSLLIGAFYLSLFVRGFWVS